MQNFAKFMRISENFAKICKICQKLSIFFLNFPIFKQEFAKFAREKMIFLEILKNALKNAYLDAKIGFDPAENEPPKESCGVAGISTQLSGELPRPRRRGLGAGARLGAGRGARRGARREISFKLLFRVQGQVPL